MRKTLLIAVLAIAVMAVPAFASVQNIKISGDIDSTWLVRDQFDLGAARAGSDGGGDNYQNLLITQTRLRVDADLTDNVSAVVGLINERVWGDEGQSSDDNDIDLNLAYVTLREMLYSPLTVVIGRQNFKYGNSFIIDSEGQNNDISGNNGLSGVAADLTKRTAQDAIRLIFDYNPLTVEILASKIDSNTNVGAGALNAQVATDDDVDLFGIHSNYQVGDDWNSEIDGYFWARIDQSTKSNGAGLKADTVYTPGVRASTNPIKGLNVQAEFAAQAGNKATTSTSGASRADNLNRKAYAAQFVANYMLPFEETAEYSPVIQAVYTHTSGDEHADDSRTGDPTSIGSRSKSDFHGWDPLFESQGGGTIYNTLFDLTNSNILEISATANPMEDITAKVVWTKMWLDETVHDRGDDTSTGTFNMAQPNTTTGFVQPVVTQNRDIGHEFDFWLTYDYTEDVQVGYTMGWFFPGSFFHRDNDQIASQILANVDVRF